MSADRALILGIVIGIVFSLLIVLVVTDGPIR